MEGKERKLTAFRSFFMERKEITVNRLTEGYCVCCGKSKLLDNFSASVNPNHYQSVMPFCKACMLKIFKNYRTLLGSDSAACWCVCMQVGYPFRYKAWEKARERGIGKSGVANKIMEYYFTEVKQLGFDNSAGWWESDKMLTDLIDTGAPKAFQSQSQVEREYSTAEMDALEKKWGHYTAQQYRYLEDTFREYTEHFVEMSPVQVRRYQDLCKAELRKRIADEGTDMGEIKNAQTILNNILSQLKLDQFDNGAQSDIERFIEFKIWQIENTEPAEVEDLNKYKDFSGFGDTWKDIMRCLRNLVAGSRDYPKLPKEAEE